MHFVQGRLQPTQSQLIQIYSVDVRTTHTTLNTEENQLPLKYQRTINTTETLEVKY